MAQTLFLLYCTKHFKTMKTKVILLLVVVFTITTAFNYEQHIHAQENAYAKLPVIDNKAFKSGEVLEYRLHYGLINAGTAKLEVKTYPKKIAGREVYHVVGTGKSAGTFDWFFKVRDRYETYLDKDGIFPWLFVRRIDEGGYKKSQDYKFLQHKNKVDNGEGDVFDTPTGVQDMLSAFYYARTLDFSKAKVGQIYTIWSFVDDEVWPLKIKYAGKETIKVGKKKYKTLKFHPVVQAGRIFKKEEDLNVWISDDKNKIPLMAQAKVLVGSIKLELKKYEGLANPIAEVK